jgi:peptidyl-tRNA hydrolase, PTH1 family
MRNTNIPASTSGASLIPYLIVGLGNPGRQYRKNRHNIGFLLVDRLAERLDVSFSRLEAKALVTKADYQGLRLVLAKPQTYMNLSGQAVASLLKFYKIPLENLLVAYDDVDLPFGSLRLRPTGGSAGQKGMASIIERLGTQDIPRLRLGVGRPPGRMDAADYVLQDFSPSEEPVLSESLERGVQSVLTFVTLGLEAAMNQFNRADENRLGETSG